MPQCFTYLLPLLCCAVIVITGGIFALTREHAEVELKRSGMSLPTNEEDSLLGDPVERRSNGPGSPLVVGPAGMRQSISEYKAAMQQVGCVAAFSDRCIHNSHAAAADYLELGRVA